MGEGDVGVFGDDGGMVEGEEGEVVLECCDFGCICDVVCWFGWGLSNGVMGGGLIRYGGWVVGGGNLMRGCWG